MKKLDFNVKEHNYMLKLIDKSLKSNSAVYVTFEKIGSTLYIYSESLLTGMKLIYKVIYIEDTALELEELFSDDFVDSTIKFTVNISFIEALLLMGDIVNIEVTDEHIIIRSEATQITYSNLSSDLTLNLFNKILETKFEDVIDKECLGVMSKVLMSINEEVYKKYIAIDKDVIYTSNNNFIIENKSKYHCNNTHLITYKMLDIVRSINPKDPEPYYINTSSEVTTIKMGNLFLTFDNLGIERFNRLLDLVDLNHYEIFVKVKYQDLQRIKILSQGGTADNHDEIKSSLINILIDDNNRIICTKGKGRNKILLKGKVLNPHNIVVDYTTLLKAVFLTSSTEVIFLVDKNADEETLVIRGGTMTVLIALEQILD